MNNLLSSLIENKKQKFIAIIYIFALIVNWNQINLHNGSGTCVTAGHDCYSLFTTSLIISVIFLILVLIFRSKNVTQQ